MQIDLSGKTVLVTGAASGIGRATALAFGEAGARVAINHLGRRREAEAVVAYLRERGVRAIACEADVTDRRQIDAMIDAATAALDGIDMLINNAGIVLERPFLDMREDEWDRVINTDLKGVFLCCQAVLPAMVARGHGCIINIASELGYLGRAGYTAYTSAKAGVIALTRSLAREFAPAIRINAIAPGPVATEMLDPALMSPAVIAHEVDIPMGRLGRPEEIATTAVFLASTHAAFYCGQTLGPNGGALMT